MLSKVGLLVERTLNKHEKWSMQDIATRVSIDCDRLMEICENDSDITLDEISAIQTGLHLSKAEVVGRGSVKGSAITLPDELVEAYNTLLISWRRKVTRAIWSYLTSKGQTVRDLEIAANLYNGQSALWRSGDSAMRADTIASMQYAFESIGISNEKFLSRLETIIASAQTMMKVERIADEKGISQSDLAKATGLKSATISNLFGMRDLFMSEYYANKIAKALDVDISELESYPGEWTCPEVWDEPRVSEEPDAEEHEEESEVTDEPNEIEYASVPDETISELRQKTTMYPLDPGISLQGHGLVKDVKPLLLSEEDQMKFDKMLSHLSARHQDEIYKLVEKYFWEDFT